MVMEVGGASSSWVVRVLSLRRLGGDGPRQTSIGGTQEPTCNGGMWGTRDTAATTLRPPAQRNAWSGRPGIGWPRCLSLRRYKLLVRDGTVVSTLAVREKAGVAEFAFGVADYAVNRFTMGAFARLFLFGVGHRFSGQHSTICGQNPREKFRGFIEILSRASREDSLNFSRFATLLLATIVEKQIRHPVKDAGSG
jgi:hypothetical protein